MQLPSLQTVRTFLLTASVITITIGGTLYGAELKSKQEVKQANEKREQATIDEKIESLQTMRANLVAKKATVEKQLQDLEARMEEKKRKGPVARGGSSTES
ncbi:hypothetical protein VTN96DRAFT_5264 [Rasamsonia emersonii]|uniref:Uncharacterized protein n=1 Tax=Rasamsonia emersonii (strain ATCC 16479 / CBS 393.64 / IMI 116815) TaxID=1408163 RepID=A0A0F4YIZ0_RASE3|nr:hypothetical protein T310_8485 [Rasamsonia emersonii CBS 393.64]KKA17578.1 hypothetical protein T310_8485 [Rasamsonia emersonii CBS 393.64]